MADTVFNKNYIICKNTSGLTQLTNNNLNQAFSSCGIPLLVHSSSTASDIYLTMNSSKLTWKGQLILESTDEWCTYLKCKDKYNESQYFYAENGKFILGTNGTIGCYEFGFGMSISDAYKFVEDSKTVKVLQFAQNLSINEQNIDDKNTVVLYGSQFNESEVTLTQLGMYGISGKKISFITGKSSEWGEDEGYIFSTREAQDYGKISSNKAKRWASNPTTSVQVVFQNFTKQDTSSWIFSIKKDNDVRILEYNKQKYIIGENGRVKLYKRGPGTLSRTINSSGFPNYIPENSPVTDKDSLFTYPYVKTGSSWSLKPNFDLSLISDTATTENSDYSKRTFIDYICECEGSDIYVKELDEGSYGFNSSTNISMTTKSSETINLNTDVVLGVLMDEWKNPVNSMSDSRYWTVKYIGSTNLNATAHVNYVRHYSNIFTEGTYYPPMRGILRLKNLKLPEFLQELYPEDYKYATPGNLSNEAKINWIGVGNSNFIQHYTLLRDFSLAPGIADLKGFDLTESGDNWNKTTQQWNVPDYSIPWTAFHQHQPIVYDRAIGEDEISYPFTSIGFRRTNDSEYCYCLTIEYPETVCTWSCTANGSDLIITITNNTNETITVRHHASTTGNFLTEVVKKYSVYTYEAKNAAESVKHVILQTKYIDPITQQEITINWGDHI